MEVASLNNILSRRSIRKYSEKGLERKDIEHILSAADSAPCAKGLRSWHFIVIDERPILDRVPKFHPFSKMILKAPLAILVCGDTKIEPVEGYWVQNCSAATVNILLGANELGLGSVWLGIYPREQRISGMRELIEIPDHITPFSLVVIGWPGEVKEPYEGYDRSRVHFNSW